MASIRPLLLAAALPFAAVACGGDDGGPVVPEGEHYQYVASRVLVPATNTQAREYGLDLDGNQTIDNQLGMVLGILATMNFDVQGSVDESVADGSIILLADVQTTDFMNASAAGLKILLGDNPMPQPCTDPANPTIATCGKHLTGTGTFSIAASSPTDALLAGPIVGGTFNGGPGTVSLQISLGADALQLNLVGARAKASGISADGITSAIVAGALTENDLNTTILPAIQEQLVPTIAADCTDLTNPGAECGCVDGSTGQTLLTLFDIDPKDCMVTVDEIKSNGLIQGALAPDVTIDGMPALSLGIKLEAKKASFPAQ